MEFLSILAARFGTSEAEVSKVEFEVRYRGADLERLTTITRTGAPQRLSSWTPIRRA
jgi:hypothetical protein